MRLLEKSPNGGQTLEFSSNIFILKKEQSILITGPLGSSALCLIVDFCEESSEIYLRNFNAAILAVLSLRPAIKSQSTRRPGHQRRHWWSVGMPSVLRKWGLPGVTPMDRAMGVRWY